MFYTYIYLDPRKKGNFVYENLTFDYEPFYVGKGSNNRINVHVSNAKFFMRNNLKVKSYKINKIISILRENLEPIRIKIFESVSEEEIFQKEIETIKLIGRKDLKNGFLLNKTDGGDGARNQIFTYNTKLKMSLSKKGKKLSESHRKNIISSLIGRKHSIETKKKMSESRKNLMTEEIKNNISIKNKGKIVSEESRLKMSLSKKGKKGHLKSEETKLKISKANKGKIRDEETKLKISESIKEMWLNGHYDNKNNSHGPLSEETKLKISESLKGRVFSEETKNKISKSKKNPSEETRKKMSDAKKEYWKNKKLLKNATSQ